MEWNGKPGHQVRRYPLGKAYGPRLFAPEGGPPMTIRVVVCSDQKVSGGT